MPTLSTPSDTNTQAAIHSAVTFAETFITRLAGAPSKGDIRQSRAITEITARFSADNTALEAAALLPYLGEHALLWSNTQKDVPQNLAHLISNLADLRLIDQLNSHRQSSSQHEPLRRMLLAMVNDLRCVVIKIAEHLRQLRNAKSIDTAAQQELAQRSFSLYAPLANRLGIWQLKWEIEDLGLRYSQPEQYKALAKKLKDKRMARERYIKESVIQIQAKLSEQHITAEVLGRPKHIYSIYRKMQKKQLRFEQLYDIRAMRVLVNTDAECYAALGIVHSLWTPIAGEFDDYLAKPKANGYRSIHTAVYAHEGQTLEVQIRTHSMHAQAELGVAAHWRYKEGATQQDSFDQKIDWLRELLQTSQHTDDDLIPTLTNQVFEDYIYVITPAGDVIDLPAGATAVDFAFEIHTQVGYRCRGARINGNIAPLNTRLSSGDQVEVLTAKTAKPSRDWLNPQLGYAATAKTRTCLRTWFRALDRDDNITAGRDIIERELKRLGQTLLSYDELARLLKKNDAEQLLAAIGAGDISPGQLAAAIQPKPTEGLRILARNGGQEKAAAGIHIQGIGKLMSSAARCCRPVPGDAVTGFVTRGRGVSIHRNDCKKLLQLQAQHHERVIDVCWGNAANQQLPVDIKIEAWDRYGLIRDISSVLANDRVNVLGIRSSSNTQEHKAFIEVSVEVKDLEALSLVCNRVAQVPNVIDVSRA